MSLYHIQEASFELPAQSADKSLNIFSIPDGPGRQASLVITRDNPRRGLTLAQYAERILMEMEEKLHQFDLQLRREVLLGGASAIQFDYTWVSDGTPMVQRQLVLLLPAAEGTVPIGLLVSFTGTQWSEGCEQLYQGFLTTFRPRITP